MSITDKRLLPVLQQLDAIEHVKSIRLHSRILTVLPSRITPYLCEMISTLKKSICFVAHINSHLEFSAETDQAIRRLKRAGVSVLSQSVLLKGINDEETKLRNLLDAFVERGIVAYYLHYPDLAKGTSHFRISLEKAMGMVTNLRGKIPGYAIPELIIDIPGVKVKFLLSHLTYSK